MVIGMKIALISFSRTGFDLGEYIRAGLCDNGHEAAAYTKSKYVKEAISEPLSIWTKKQFKEADAIIYIGACGIAVRTIAPFLKNKEKDPGVVVIDEQGKFTISLLSGHIGSANRLTHEISKIINAAAVITTATDISNTFAVDVFAGENDLFISDMKLAKEVSAALLAGEAVGLLSDFPIEGEVPEELGIVRKNKENLPKLGIYISASLANQPFVQTLYLVPRVITVGIGCKKGVNKEAIQNAVKKVCDDLQIPLPALEQVASIDIKKEEPGIAAYCFENKLPFVTYSKEELEGIEGDFTKSKFVESRVGVDNVCERAAVKGSGYGRLMQGKQAKDGVTAALAGKEWRVKFE